MKTEEWISIKDRLPETDDYVLTAWSGIHIIAEYSAERWRDEGGNITTDEVTHWMPLPETPKP